MDHQVAVLTRFTVTNINKMRALNGLDFVTEEELNKFFEEWKEFYGRGDAGEYMSHWVLGKPLEDLPDPPAKQEDETGPEPSGSGPGPTEFGGDYAGDHGDSAAEQAGSEDEGPAQDDAVPVLPPQDPPDDQEEAEGSDVSELSA